MKQLSGLDATFLYMETPSQFGHVSSLSIFEKPDDPNYDAFTAWRGQIEKRLHLLEPLRRRLRDVPLRLDHPFWIDDSDFDLDFHVRNTAVPPPGSDQQLADLVARIIGRPLDRARPLWETYVIEGLPENRFAILTKVHHATIDGASGAELLTLMLDENPGGDAIDEPAEAWSPEPPPTDAEVLARAGANLVRKPGRAILLGTRTIRDFGRSTRNPALVAAANQVRNSLRGPIGSLLNLGRERTPETDVKGPLPSLSAPRTPFNASITAHRRFAYRSTSLQAVKDIKNAVGATVNDVVMAVCAGGLRTWLEDHDALTDQPLTAMIPVSIRTGDETEKWTNRVSSIFAELPTDEPDPLLRIQRVHDAMVGAKDLFDAIPAAQLTDFAQFPPPAVFARAMRLSTRLMTRINPPVNVVISNVPGPRQPLYAAGSRLLHYYPVSTIVDGQGLNITVQSYLDTLDFGLVSCRELVPDLWDMLDAILNDLAALGKATGVDVPL
ncbi:MAG TPA: wax ester/triacylglycerol synthase family O-acyltransferase [Acidimicrobiales bacterium]|nr:wax ester/triacylglycerol synthase family O-acyltransferase [Acidimicrobiales bacterium]